MIRRPNTDRTITPTATLMMAILTMDMLTSITITLMMIRSNDRA